MYHHLTDEEVKFMLRCIVEPICFEELHDFLTSNQVRQVDLGENVGLSFGPMFYRDYYLNLTQLRWEDKTIEGAIMLIYSKEFKTFMMPFFRKCPNNC